MFRVAQQHACLDVFGLGRVLGTRSSGAQAQVRERIKRAFGVTAIRQEPDPICDTLGVQARFFRPLERRRVDLCVTDRAAGSGRSGSAQHVYPWSDKHLGFDIFGLSRVNICMLEMPEILGTGGDRLGDGCGVTKKISYTAKLVSAVARLAGRRQSLMVSTSTLWKRGEKMAWSVPRR